MSELFFFLLAKAMFLTQVLFDLKVVKLPVHKVGESIKSGT